MSGADALVVGAGPGGCALAWLLARGGWEVVLVERRRGPADKLCGEFLSGDGAACLGRAGLGEVLEGAPPIGRVRISGSAGGLWEAALPPGGRGLSRGRLDAWLLEKCRGGGVQVVEGVRVRWIEGDWSRGFRVGGLSPAGEAVFGARLVVGAWGRGERLRGVGRTGAGPFMALKVHIGRAFPPLVEVHGFAGGYAGLCPVEGERTNLCLLAARAPFRRAGGDARRFAAQILARNPHLRSRLEALEPDWEGALAASGLGFGQGLSAAGGALLVGDAAGSVAPLCGDGMSMALRAAEMLAPLAASFLEGRFSGEALEAAYGERWRAEFAARLRLGQWLQWTLAGPLRARLALAVLGAFPAVGQRLIQHTRGSGP